jgi:malonyl-CoA O-methyltransferase
MSIENQFSKHANNYNSNNIIQQIVSKALVREIGFQPKTILELGCGSGQVFKNITWDFKFYKAIDFSKNMCAIHPKAKNLEVKCFNFDSEDFFKEIENENYDIILSSSALQWSNNLDLLLSKLKNISNLIHVVLFTSNTFKSIQNITGKKSPILDQDSIENSFKNHFNCEFEIFNYNLEFNNKRDLFLYIKNSGISGDSNLNFKEAKNLYKKYNKLYLEFEVIFIKAKR